MIGYRDEEDFPNVLSSWSDLLHPDDRDRVLKQYYATIDDYTGKTLYDVEYRLLTKDRGYRWFRATGKLSRRADGTPITYVGMFVDITHRKETDEKLTEQHKLLEEALERAQRASQAKTMFLNNMSHDIRTPMNAIIGFTNLAATHLDDQELVRDYLDKIRASSSHLLSLINDVLDMSRIESGKLAIDAAPCSLSQVLRDLQSIIHADVESKGLHLRLDDSALLHPYVVCDQLRLNQVLLNILSNALKFTPSGGDISVRVTERPGDSPDVPIYEFRIRDTGIGMAPEFLDHIFKPFERERTSTVSGIQGTGLGMSGQPDERPDRRGEPAGPGQHLHLQLPLPPQRPPRRPGADGGPRHPAVYRLASPAGGGQRAESGDRHDHPGGGRLHRSGSLQRGRGGGHGPALCGQPLRPGPHGHPDASHGRH